VLQVGIDFERVACGRRISFLSRGRIAGGSGKEKADPLKGRPVFPIVSGVASIQAIVGR